MNERERSLAVQLFGNPDRISFSPGSGRESTRNNWYKQGLPEGTLGYDIIKEAYKQAGGTMELPTPGPGFQLSSRMSPTYKAEVLEVKENSQIVRDWKGNVCEIGLEFDVSYLENAVDFVTRRWIKCPVESREDWLDMKKRYVAADESRIPEASHQFRDFGERDFYSAISFNGPYWQLREWCGFEGLSMMFYDDPELVREMIEFWEEYVSALLDRVFEIHTPDEVHISEDMAYKGFSMLSPAMTRDFLLPTWRKWGEKIRSAGVPIYSMDSDGFIGELIPIWLDAGFNACDPIEVAAGNDINNFRKRFGHSMAYRGGVDKREMAKGGVHIEREMERLRPVIEDGGFIPSCDHGVPSDVSWPDFVHYGKLLAELTGWL